MAKQEKITDDLTGDTIKYPFISARSIRVEFSPTKYVWMGPGDVVIFENGKNLGEWAEHKMEEILEKETERDY